MSKVEFKLKYYIAILLLLSLVSCILGVSNFHNAMLFIFYQVFILEIPGVAICVFLKIKMNNKLELISYGYLIGFTASVFLYLISSILFQYSETRIMLIVLFFVSLFYVWSKKSEIKLLPNNYMDNLFCALIIVVSIGIKFFTYYGMNFIPVTVDNYNFFSTDLLYYIGNAIELKNGYPPKDFRWYIQDFRYHYFGSIQLAVMSDFVKASVAVTEFNYAFMQGPIMLVFSMYLFIKEVVREKILIYWYIILCLFTSGFEYFTLTTYIGHIYLVPFGFDMGVSFLLIFIVVFFKISKYENIKWNLLFMGLSFLIMLVGVKAPLAVALLSGVLLYGLYEFFLLKRYKKVAVYLSFFLLTFVFMYFRVISYPLGTELSDKGLHIGFFTLLFESDFCAKIVNIIPPKLIVVLFPFITISYYVLSAPAIWGLLLFSCILFFRKKNRIHNFVDIIFLITITLSGIILSQVSQQEGKSQMYFVIGIYPIAVSVALFLISKGELLKLISSRKTKILSITVTIIGITIFTIGTCNNFYSGYKKIIGKDNTVYAENQPNIMSKDEYDAYEWIRVNTKQDAIIVSNVMLTENQGRSYITGAFTERRNWFEGWEYGYIRRDEAEINNKKIQLQEFIEDRNNKDESCKLEEVNYLILLKRITPHFQNSNGHQVVYENKAVAVYLIK